SNSAEKKPNPVPLPFFYALRSRATRPNTYDPSVLSAEERKGPAAARPDFSPSTQVLELRKLPLSFRLQRQFGSAGIVPTYSAPILPEADQRKRPGHGKADGPVRAVVRIS